MYGSFLGFEKDRDIFEGLYKVFHKPWLSIAHALNKI